MLIGKYLEKSDEKQAVVLQTWIKLQRMDPLFYPVLLLFTMSDIKFSVK